MTAANWGNRAGIKGGTASCGRGGEVCVWGAGEGVHWKRVHVRLYLYQHSTPDPAGHIILRSVFGPQWFLRALAGLRLAVLAVSVSADAVVILEIYGMEKIDLSNKTSTRSILLN